MKVISLRPTIASAAPVLRNVVRTSGYGITEMAQVTVRCEARRYHRAPPGLIALVLDVAGRAPAAEPTARRGRWRAVRLLDLSSRALGR